MKWMYAHINCRIHMLRELVDTKERIRSLENKLDEILEAIRNREHKSQSWFIRVLTFHIFVYIKLSVYSCRFNIYKLAINNRVLALQSYREPSHDLILNVLPRSTIRDQCPIHSINLTTQYLRLIRRMPIALDAVTCAWPLRFEHSALHPIP